MRWGLAGGFIRNMVTTEVFTISVIFGFIGMIAGMIVLMIIGLIGFEATNPFLEILFAGPVLKPVFFSLLGFRLLANRNNYWNDCKHLSSQTGIKSPAYQSNDERIGEDDERRKK